MRAASAAFKTAMKAPIKEVIGKIIVAEGDEIVGGGDLISYTIETASVAVGKSAMRKLTATYLGTRNLVGHNIEIQLGVRVASGDFEFISLGSFLVSQAQTIKDKDSVKITGYDRMVYGIIKYLGGLTFTYPTTVSGLYEQIVAILGQEAATLDIPLGDLTIESDLYENISGFTYRDALEEIAILGGAVVTVDKDDKIALRNIKTPDNTVEALSYDDLLELTLKDVYGEVNSVVLSRQPQEDNVIAAIDEDSIAENGLAEIKIINNQIIDKRREDVGAEIAPYFMGTTYYPFKAKTVGLGYLEIGDAITIEDSESIVRDVRVLGLTLTVDGGIKETIWSDEPSKTETNYARAGGLDNRIKNTELVVDKQNQLIQSVISELATIDGVINDNYTEIMQTINEITQTVQSAGGANLLKNSAFFQFDNSGIPTIWTTTGAGTLNIQASSEAIANGSLSGNIITLKGTKVTQAVSVVRDYSTTPEAEKIYYSFKILVKKGILGEAKIRLSSGADEYVETIPDGTATEWHEVKINAILPADTTLTVELEGDATSDATFSDATLTVGKYSAQWQQANGEILNTQVQINDEGIIVKSSIYAGDYTAITPLEFSGYTRIGGSTIKAFALNKDQTEVEKILVRKQVDMPPIKIVPITSGSVTGWAYVKRG